MKILIVTYYWPPSGGAGVQRWLKFSKYLPDLGWEPIILTVDPAYATYPATDTSLEKETDPSLKVIKTKAVNYFAIKGSTRQANDMPSTMGKPSRSQSFGRLLARFIRGNFFIPDPRRGWNRFAVKEAYRLIREFDIKYLVTTSPPHSTQLVGLKIKRKFPDIRWIADLRDPWTDIYYYNQFYPSPISRLIDRRYEKLTFKKANLITTAGNHVLPGKIIEYNLDPDKIKVVLNGFDDEDFKGLKPEHGGVCTITYVGSISESYPVRGFIKAINLLEQSGIRVIVKFVGFTHDQVKMKFLGNLQTDSLVYLPYLDHKDAIREMMNSSLLMLIIPDHTENRNIIPGKLFEYLGTGNPILCIGPEGSDVQKILLETGAGNSFDGENPEEIAEYIMANMKSPWEYEHPANYTRKSLAEKFAAYLNSLD